jgi:Carboxypeptidase regulatory-like domain/TonB-dependent Receptor Plug Domain
MPERQKTRTRLFGLESLSWTAGAIAVAFALCLMSGRSIAQTGGGGAISGSIADSTGAVVPNASVVARNDGTGVETKRTTSSDGLYNIAPLIPGNYTLTVTASGFATFEQKNITVYALGNVGINVTLKTGSQDETVTVSAAPPALETTNATLGGTIDNNFVSKLPIMITGLQQRDITQFSNLLPGAQVPPGGRSSIIGGTGQRLGELYVDGLPITTLSQQADNRPVFNIIPLEAIDQVNVVTSGFSAEYQGAGLENYSLKSGTNLYHGAIFGYFRNTVFDAWSFSSKPGGGNTQKVVENGVVTTVPGPKPAENQNEVGFSVGGPVKIPFLFNGKDKLFFYAAYDRFHSTQGANPSATTVPTTLMQQGNFQELIPASSTTGGLGNSSNVNYPVYDPTTLQSCTSHSSNGPCRYQYGYGPGQGTGANGNPVLVSPGKVNVIPASELSPISQYQQSFLPTPTVTTTGTIQNNYLAGVPQGYDNWLYSGRGDYNISERQTLSVAVTGGNRHAIPYTSSSNAPLPVPYYASTISTVAGHWVDTQHTFTITPHVVNQFKFGFMNFGGPPVQNITGTTGNGKYALSASGITGLPAGQASANAANTAFSGSNAPAGWVGNTPTTTNVSETFTLVDNVNWLKGRHSMNFGGQYQWLQNNASTADGPSQPTPMNWSTNETAQITPNGSTYIANSGYSYASFLIGAVSSTSAVLQPFSVVGGRFHPFALYFQDDYKVMPKLTLNLGLRWDNIPTYTESQNRWSFLNPNITNPVTGNLGALQFAGNHGGTGVSCNCSTPANNYYKNFGPRLGFAYSADDKTVFRGGWGVLFSHAGGTGGAGGAATGTGQAGFNSTVSFADSPAGPNAGPAFWLNNNPSFQNANANYGGPGYTIPAIAPIGAVSQTLGTGYYECAGQSFTPCNGATGTFSGIGTGISYPDPYLSGRAPQFIFWNFGMQREVNSHVTVTANYVGSQSHFLTGANNMRGLQSGELDPKWFALTSYLTKPATQANINAAEAATGATIPVPYASYVQAAGLSTGANATIQHMLTWMPQYSGTTDTWGDVANANYNAFQLSVSARDWHGLTMNVNYTYSKNIDDAGTARSGYAIPASATLAGHAWAQNRIDRSLSLNSQPQNVSVYGVYSLPFGKGRIGNDHFLVRALLGGWDFSNIFQYSSGLPLAVVSTCVSPQSLGQGQCMPDVNPNFFGSVRINGGWGNGVTAATLGTRKYMTANPGNPTSTSLGGFAGGGSGSTSASNIVPCLGSSGPFCDSGNYMIGDAPRIAPYRLRGPSVYRWTSALRKTIDLNERFKFVFGIDCQNVTNAVTFGNNASNNQIGVNVDTSTFGALNFASADARAFQFSGRITF